MYVYMYMHYIQLLIVTASFSGDGHESQAVLEENNVRASALCRGDVMYDV